MWGESGWEREGGGEGIRWERERTCSKKSLLLGGQQEEALSRGGVEEERWGGEMKEGLREEESGLRT